MLMTSHFYRIHTSYAIITVSTVAACLFLLFHPVHESRFVEQTSLPQSRTSLMKRFGLVFAFLQCPMFALVVRFSLISSNPN